MEAPRELIGKYRERPVVPLPESNPLRKSTSDQELKLVQQVYAAMVDSMDQAIGNILQTLDDEGIADNTIVLFFSDNGGFNGFGGNNLPLRGEKMTVFEGGLRVPSVIRWPGNIPAGSQSHQVLSVMDVFPTLASAAGVAMQNSKPLEGVDAWPLQPSSSYQARNGDVFFVAESSAASPYFYAMIRGPWKLVQVIREDLYSKQASNLLFNIEQDPEEHNNLAAEHPQRVAELGAAIAQWAADHPVGGQHVEIAPNPGWLPPRDWADVVIPADKTLPTMDDGFGKGKAERLQQFYQGRGSVIYK